MLILIGIVPGYFALDATFDARKLSEPLHRLETLVGNIDPTPLSEPDRLKLQEAVGVIPNLQTKVGSTSSISKLPRVQRFEVRKDILVMDRNLNNLIKKEELKISALDKKTIKDDLKALRKVTDYSPGWVIVIISLSLGLGTMIGWKRIVRTIGEKIGKEHLSYAQGASAELVAASTIGMSSYFGLPVSTTHVLSSGIAGSMVANKGVKNLQPDTVRNILLAWFLTLPIVMTLSGSLFLLFRSAF